MRAVYYGQQEELWPVSPFCCEFSSGAGQTVGGNTCGEYYARRRGWTVDIVHRLFHRCV